MVFLAALQLPQRGVAGLLFFGFSCVVCVCGAGGARTLVCCARLWGSCGWRLWRCVLCGRAGVCAACWWCVWVPVPASLGLFWRLCVGAEALCRGPSPALAVRPGCGSPPPLLCALPPLSLCRVAWGAVPLVPCPGLPGLWWVCGGAGWRGEGVLDAGSGPFPWCFPLAGLMLALPVRV